MSCVIKYSIVLLQRMLYIDGEYFNQGQLYSNICDVMWSEEKQCSVPMSYDVGRGNSRNEAKRVLITKRLKIGVEYRLDF